jgi:hypothetical protein
VVVCVAIDEMSTANRTSCYNGSFERLRHSWGRYICFWRKADTQPEPELPLLDSLRGGIPYFDDDGERGGQAAETGEVLF